MSTATLPPMVDGGRWMDTGKQVTYVAHPEHVKRLVLEGAQFVEDPRPKLLAEGKISIQPRVAQPSEAELALQAKIEKLEAMLAQFMAGKTEEAKVKK
jgi:hypothetical protein